MNKMYEYLLDHNYISENKTSNYQSELSIERAKCIANKYDYLITELKQALNEIKEYIAKEIQNCTYGQVAKYQEILEIIDKVLEEDLDEN